MNNASLVTFDKKRQVWTWDLNNCGRIYVNTILSRDGKWIAKSGSTSGAHVWNVETGEIAYAMKENEHAVTYMVFSYDSVFLVMGSADHTVRVWDVTTGECRRVFNMRTADNEVFSYSPLRAVAISRDNTRIAASAMNGRILIWDFNTEDVVHTLDMEYAIWKLAFSSDNQFLIYATSSTNTIHLCSIVTGQCVSVLFSHWDYINSIEMSPDGKSIVTASDDGSAVVVDIATGSFVSMQHHDEVVVTAACFSPDGRFILTGTRESLVYLWRASTGQRIDLYLSLIHI